MNETSAPLIIKLGGSVISHSNKTIDFNYLREFRDMLKEQILLNRRFVVVSGGGQNSREVIKHAREEGNITSESALHSIGTAVNTMNAEVIRAFLGDDIAEDHVWKYQDKDNLQDLKYIKPIAVAGGFEPGKSGDWVALRVAQALSSYRIYNLKMVDGVYTEDPKENPEAEYISEITWKDYLELIGNPANHEPGGSYPVDPIAAKEAQELGATYYILKANDFDNIEKALNGEDFHGTKIQPNT
jgi:predicted uridylate kinase